MKQFCALIFFTLLTAGCMAQVPLVKQRVWSVRAGTDINIPITHSYYDFSVIKGADYYWEYQARPSMGIGYYAEACMLKNFRMRKAVGFITYGLGYRQTVRQLDYTGWEGGGVNGSYVYNAGEGFKRWNDHYAVLSAKLTQQFCIGINKRLLLNSLGLSAGFKIYEKEERFFTGSSSYTNGTVLINALGYTEQHVNDEFYIPQLHLNYEFGFPLFMKSTAVVPTLTVPVLNFNNYLQKYEPINTPLKLRREYYKELMVGIMIMPGVER